MTVGRRGLTLNIQRAAQFVLLEHLVAVELAGLLRRVTSLALLFVDQAAINLTSAQTALIFLPLTSAGSVDKSRCGDSAILTTKPYSMSWRNGVMLSLKYWVVIDMMPNRVSQSPSIEVERRISSCTEI